MDLDLAAVRAFVAIAEERQFQHAADLLGISQQAVSKRIAKLETQLAHPLFVRARSGAVLTAAGERFLPHARGLLQAALAAVAELRNELPPLRIAVHAERMATTELLRFYLDRNPDADTEVIMSAEVVLSGVTLTSRNALINGTVDAAFARAADTTNPLPREIAHTPAYLEPLHLLVGKDHPFAGRDSVGMREIGTCHVWVPGAAAPTEWADYYRHLADGFDITIDTSGPNIGFVDLVARIADSPTLITFTGEGSRTPWHPGIRRVPIINPTPAYPWSLLWRRTNTHPKLRPLISDVTANYNRDSEADTWIPSSDREAVADADGCFGSCA